MVPAGQNYSINGFISNVEQILFCFLIKNVQSSKTKMVEVKYVSANFQGILLHRLNLTCVWSKLNKHDLH